MLCVSGSSSITRHSQITVATQVEEKCSIHRCARALSGLVEAGDSPDRIGERLAFLLTHITFQQEGCAAFAYSADANQNDHKDGSELRRSREPSRLRTSWRT